MSYEFASPYREVGLTSTQTKAPKRRQDPPVRVGSAQRDARRLGHNWGTLHYREGQPSKTPVCRRCGKPKFAVEGQKCRGAR